MSTTPMMPWIHFRETAITRGQLPPTIGQLDFLPKERHDLFTKIAHAAWLACEAPDVVAPRFWEAVLAKPAPKVDRRAEMAFVTRMAKGGAK